MKSCTDGYSEKKYNDVRRRIPNGIELTLGINFDDNHPQHRYNEEKGFCGEVLSDSHLECRRFIGHKGKHWCFECGESWKK